MKYQFSIPTLLRHLFTCLVLTCGMSTLVSCQEKQALDAQKAWDALIQRKGGAKKLAAIENVLTRFSSLTRLEVFSGKDWEFDQSFGTPSLTITNNGVTHGCDLKGKCESRPGRIGGEIYLTDRIAFLLETKSDRPEPIRVFREKRKKRSLDTITTRFGDWRVDFAYDSEEMLVEEVTFYTSAGLISDKYLLTDYSAVDGILMPGKFAKAHPDPASSYHTLYVSFNVDYDPKIFEPPFKATNADAWKPKPKQ